MKKTIVTSAIAVSIMFLILLSAFAPMTASKAATVKPKSKKEATRESGMTFTTGEKITFTTDEEMTFGTGHQIQVGSGVKMKFQSTVEMHFIEIFNGNGVIEPCDEFQVTWPFGFLPVQCSWWEVIDPATGAGLGEFHVDWTIQPDIFHIDMVWPGPFVVGPGVIIAKEKIDVVEPCEIYEVHWPSGWYPEPCTWWEIIDPETGDLTGYEFHVDWTNESCEFHIDEMIPGPYILPFPWFEIWAKRKIPVIDPCTYVEVEEPPDWWPEPCSWWEIIDPTGLPTGYEFHVDWTNESCEFHIDEVIPEPYVFPFPGVPNFYALEKVSKIEPCNWFIIQDPQGYTPEICSWWEVLDEHGHPTGDEFHIDEASPGTFHVDEVTPGPTIIIAQPELSLTVRKKITRLEPCEWFKVDDLALTPRPCTWWHILYPPHLEGIEFHVDDSFPGIGTFHIDTVYPTPIPVDPPTYDIIAEKKIDQIFQCDWFEVLDPPGFLPNPCSWWEIVDPLEWAGVKFHVDINDGVLMFHVDFVDGVVVPPTPPPWNVTATPYIPPPPDEWYIKQPYPDYAPSGVPDFDQKQDGWGPGQGIWTWCGPVAVANSIWWLDSEFESLLNPSPVPPPAISDSYPLIIPWGPWDDHDQRNVQPLVLQLAFLMDTDGQRTGLPHIGTNYIDMQVGISQYLQQQGINPIGDADGDGDVDDDDLTIISNAMFSIPPDPHWDMAADVSIDNMVDIIDWDLANLNYGMTGEFYEHTEDFPDFFWIEDEIYRCEDVVLFLEFWWDVGPNEWIPLYDNPSLEAGHYVTVAGVNSTTIEFLISDPYHDPHEAGLVPGHSPIPHPYTHTPDIHNDTQYVSHDAYSAAFWMEPPLSPYPGMPVWELVGYLQALGYDPSWHAFIRAAIVTSPLEMEEHDVAVINMTTTKAGCLGGETVGDGKPVNITVTAENQGGFTETFNVTVYANTTVIDSQQLTLNPGENQTFTVTWNTTGAARGSYNIRAVADIVPGETDTADNTMYYGVIFVTITGDIDGDRDVDIFDITRMASRYGMEKPHPNWDPNSDIDDDGDIDIFDVVAAASNYGQSW